MARSITPRPVIAALIALLTLLATPGAHGAQPDAAGGPPDAPAILTGRILADDGATGVAAYSLSLLSPKGRILATAYPDAEGRYRFAVAAGDYVLRAVLDLPWLTQQSRPVSLAPGEQFEDIVLAAAPFITVDVRDDLGQPVAGAEVMTMLYIGADRATTGEDGRARLRLPVPETSLHVRAPGHIARTLTVQAEGRTGVTLPRAASITGRIVGAPIPDAQPLHATFEVPSRSRVAVTTTVNPDGTFTIDGFDSGAGRLTLFAPGLLATTVEGVLLERPLASAIPDLQATPDRRLTIRVIDSGGAPIPGAHVVFSHAPIGAFQWTGDTDAQGAVTFAGVPPGRYSARIHDRAGWCGAEEHNLLFDDDDLAAGARLAIPVLRSTSVTGTFAWPEGVEGLQAPTMVQINAHSLLEPTSELWTASLSSDHPGRFTVDTVRPGRWRLHFQVDDDYWSLLETVVIPEPDTPGGTHDLGAIELNPLNPVEPRRG